VVQCALLPCSGKAFPARVAVNQADDDVPHDRTPLFDPSVLIPAIRFPVSSRDHENGFVGATEWFRGLCTMKQLHGFAITAVRTSALLAVWCRAQRGQAEYDRLAALCINAGHSNPQQGFVCRGRAKVRCHSALVWELIWEPDFGRVSQQPVPDPTNRRHDQKTRQLAGYAPHDRRRVRASPREIC
jgi:hypothetical protein